MQNNRSVRKSSGEHQSFSAEKLRNSLLRAGATSAIADAIIGQIEPTWVSGTSTRKIFRQAFALLRRQKHSLAARYSLKNAIMELGPTGYPFEHFVGEIFRSRGYSVEVGVTLPGRCVTHEIDVLARNKKTTIMVECKYHNTGGRICNVQVPLYIRSRFNDMLDSDYWNQNRTPNFEGWVFTNTRFSEDAERFGRCSGLLLVGWDYPKNGSLREIIETAGLFPVTVLTQINRRQKLQLIERNIILCHEIRRNPGIIDFLNLAPTALKRLMFEIEELCS